MFVLFVICLWGVFLILAIAKIQLKNGKAIVYISFLAVCAVGSPANSRGNVKNSRFRWPLYYTAALNLHIVILYSFCCRSFIYFRRAKVAKRPARGKMRLSECKGNLFTLLSVSILFKNQSGSSLFRNCCAISFSRKTFVA